MDNGPSLRADERRWSLPGTVEEFLTFLPIVLKKKQSVSRPEAKRAIIFWSVWNQRLILDDVDGVADGHDNNDTDDDDDDNDDDDDDDVGGEFFRQKNPEQQKKFLRNTFRTKLNFFEEEQKS